MDGKRDALERKFDSLLQELASVGEQLQRRDRPQGRVPHYSEIEKSAHSMARRLSQAIQAEASLEIAAQPQNALCPDCGRSCRLNFQKRKLESVDGAVAIHEAKGFCRVCQRSFFPSA